MALPVLWKTRHRIAQGRILLAGIVKPVPRKEKQVFTARVPERKDVLAGSTKYSLMNAVRDHGILGYSLVADMMPFGPQNSSNSF